MFSWGCSEVYEPFERCFTKEELIDVLFLLKRLKNEGFTHPRLDEWILKVATRLKEIT